MARQEEVEAADKQKTRLDRRGKQKTQRGFWLRRTGEIEAIDK